MKKFVLVLFLIIFVAVCFSSVNLDAADRNTFNVVYDNKKNTAKVNWISDSKIEKATVYINDKQYDVTGLDSYTVPVNKDTLYIFKLTNKDSSSEQNAGLSAIYTGEITSLNTKIVSSDKIELKYNKVNNVSGYYIYRKSDDKDYVLIHTAKKEENTYVDTDIEENKIYIYKVLPYYYKNGVKYLGSSNVESKESTYKFNDKKEHSKTDNKSTKDIVGENANSKLDLKSSYGDDEAYHPDVLYFENKWHGYKYWLVFTPYPNVKGSSLYGDYTKENPHIRASNDMKHWIIPSLEANPLDEPDYSQVKDKIYNSDADIVYNKFLDRIECFWRRYTGDKITIYMKYTTDGKHWSKKEVVYEVETSKDILLSPAIIYENGIYKMWYINGYIVRYKEFRSVPFKEPLKEKDIYVNTKENNAYPWHLDVIKADDKYRMIYCGTPKKGEIRYMSLYYSESEDGMDFDSATKILSPSNDKKAWDNRGIYRSTFLYKDDKYYVLYSASNVDNQKGTGIVFGEEIDNLKPLFKK